MKNLSKTELTELLNLYDTIAMLMDSDYAHVIKFVPLNIKASIIREVDKINYRLEKIEEP